MLWLACGSDGKPFFVAAAGGKRRPLAADHDVVSGTVGTLQRTGVKQRQTPRTPFGGTGNNMFFRFRAAKFQQGNWAISRTLGTNVGLPTHLARPNYLRTQRQTPGYSQHQEVHYSHNGHGLNIAAPS